MREKLETLPMTELREIALPLKTHRNRTLSGLMYRVLPVLTKSLYKRLQNLLRKPLSQKQHISTRIRRHQNRIPSTSHSTAALWQMGFLK